MALFKPHACAGGQVFTGYYDATGLYGEDNPNEITLPFAPKFLHIYGVANLNSSYHDISILEGGLVPLDIVTTEFSKCGQPNHGSTHSAYTFIKKSEDGKKISWYSTVSETYQLNAEGDRYFFVAWG